MRALRACTVAVLGLGLVAAGCGSGGGESPAQAKQKITANWEKFFDPNATTKERTDLLQNASKLQAVIQTQATNPLAKGIKAKVTDVSLAGDTATVTYNILNAATNDTLLAPGSKGTAVKQDGKWKVSQTTFCGLVAAGGGKCP